MRRGRAIGAAAAALVAIGIALPGPAPAAVTIGDAFVPGAMCSNGQTEIASVSPPNGFSFRAPTAGVITSWSFQGGGTVPDLLRLKAVRGDSPTLTTVGRGAGESPVANTLNTYATRIPVHAGDAIGFYGRSGSPTYPCGRQPMPGYAIDFFGADAAVGSADVYLNAANVELDLSAALEPDADGDDFGDETQDLCPSDPDQQRSCRDAKSPQTTIDKRPKRRTTRRKATFGFSSSEPGTFKCSVDGKPFADCESPLKLKAKSGRHTFTVLARDAAGNVDETPATASWTVQRNRGR